MPDWSTFSPSELTLTTFHVGSAKSLAVLQDWIDFFGAAANHVRMVTATSYAQCFTADTFHTLFPRAEIVDLDPIGQSVTELDSPAVLHAITTAPTRWVAIVKLDTLPYRTASDSDWLNRAVAAAASRQCWGITFGASHRCRPFSPRYAETQSFSQNCAIINRVAWEHSFTNGNPDLSTRVRQRLNSAQDRYLMEATIESELAKNDIWNLRLVDSSAFSIFHINKWEDELLEIRDRYLRRDGIMPYLNGPHALPKPSWTIPGWRRYYGHPRPSLRFRARCLAGRLKRFILTNRGSTTD
jgi:hypothetical protein